MDNESCFNLLDPMSLMNNSNISNASSTHKNFYTILESKNPDKELEFFWLVFKDNVIKYVGDVNAKHMIKLSNTLNDLQSKEKYDEIKIKISDFLNNHIDTICIFILLSKNKHAILHLHTNIIRWTKQDDKFKQTIKKTFSVKTIIIVSKLIKRKNNHLTNLLTLLIKYIKLHTLDKYSNDCFDACVNLFEYSVKNNISSICKLIASHIDFMIYTDDENECQQYRNMKGNKLVKKFKKIIEK